MSNTAEQIEETEESNVQQLPAPVQRAPIVVHDDIPVLDTGRFEQMQRIATAMSKTSLVPEHLRKQGSEEGMANCFLVVNQAVRWRMDPFALAQHAFVVHGRLGYEGKVVAAVVNGHRRLTRKLSYEYEGEGDTRKVTVSGTLNGEATPRTIEGTLAKWKTNNDSWKNSPDQMLAYRGAREWARRHMPEAMLGVFTDDELMESPMRDITPPTPPSPPSPPPAPPPTAKQEIIPPTPKKPGQRTGTPYKDMASEDRPFDPDEWLDGLDSMLAGCSDQGTLDEVWNNYAQPLIENGTVMKPDREKAEEIWERHVTRVEGDETAA